MKIKTIEMKREEYEELMYLTNNKFFIKTEDIIKYFKPFFGEYTEEITKDNPEYICFTQF